jgi:hypothetical protein
LKLQTRKIEQLIVLLFSYFVLFFYRLDLEFLKKPAI